MSTGATVGPPTGRPFSMNGASGDGAYGVTNGVQAANARRKPTDQVFPHIDDLLAVKPDVNIHSPIRRLLLDAESYAKQADTHLDFRRPALALQEYIKASTIAVEIIPYHKDYIDLKSDRGDLHRLYLALQKRINLQHAKFEEVKEVIKANNGRSGVQRSHVAGSNSQDTNSQRDGKIRPVSLQFQGRTNNASGTVNSSQLVGEYQNSGEGIISSNSNSTKAGGYTHASRQKPSIQPKPDALHGRSISLSSTNGSTPTLDEDLATRFARLRRAELSTSSVAQDPRIRTRPIAIPDAADSNPRGNSASIPAVDSQIRPDRPSGPRDMPSVPLGPPRPSKLPLEVQIPSMPRAPDAIYSPAGNDGPPRIIPRNSYGPVARPGSVVFTKPPIHTASASNDKFEYFPPAPAISSDGPPKRTAGANLPDSTTVTAEELMEYLRRGSQELRMLLVDIRSRELFDGGHIMSHSIICIEPIVLREAMSAEEIAQSLVLSPDAEQKLFDKRHEFDLVVYYDQSSISNRYSGPTSSVDEIPLRDFSKAVYDYGYEKQLTRPPMLLVGGLDSWIDLVGQGALGTSMTAAPSELSGKGLPTSHTTSRVTLSRNNNKRLPTARRRTYESRPLTQEEEDKWKETLKGDEPSSPNTRQGTESDDLSYIRTTEDFFRRYPDPSAIQESMVSPGPSSTVQVARAPKQGISLAGTLASHQDELNALTQKLPSRPPAALARQSYNAGHVPPAESLNEERGWNLPSVQSISMPVTPRGHTGLHNFGNTCYMNSAIQGLSSTQWLPDYLLGGRFDEAGPPPRKKDETSDPPQLLTRNLAYLMRHLWSGQYSFVTPKTLRNYVYRLHRLHSPAHTDVSNIYGGPGQQDTHDFLIFILLIMEDETHRGRNKPEYERPSDSEVQVLATKPLQIAADLEWNRYQQYNDSPIVNRFRGQTVIEIVCRHCKYRSLAFDYWITMQLAISSENMTLEKALENQYSPQKANDYKCDQCKNKNTAVRKETLTHGPETLIIQLKRHIYQSDGRLAKIMTKIEFPENGLRLAGVEGGTYNCYAVIQHQGTSLSCGHYWTIARNLRNNPSQWFQFNDTHVNKVDFKATQTNQSYVLFYQRKT